MSKISEAQRFIDGTTIAQMNIEFAHEFRGVYPDDVVMPFVAVGPMNSYVGLAVKNGHLIVPEQTVVTYTSEEVEKMKKPFKIALFVLVILALIAVVL